LGGKYCRALVGWCRAMLTHARTIDHTWITPSGVTDCRTPTAGCHNPRGAGAVPAAVIRPSSAHRSHQGAQTGASQADSDPDTPDRADGAGGVPAGLAASRVARSPSSSLYSFARSSRRFRCLHETRCGTNLEVSHAQIECKDEPERIINIRTANTSADSVLYF
jgi:hypothetical protein